MTESKMTFSTEELTEAYYSDFISLKNQRQRGIAWKPTQQSLLIHSIYARFPIPSLYAIQEGGQYYIIDGKQRTFAVASFLNNEYALTRDTPLFKLKSGELYNADGLYFNELPEEIQKKIKSRTIDIIHVSDADSDELNELFYRLNAGTGVAHIYKSCARARSITEINLMGEHDVFTYLTANALNKYKHKEAVFKSYLALYINNPSFTPKDIEREMMQANISEDDVLSLWEIYEIISEVGNYIMKNAAVGTVKKIMDNIINPNNFAALTTVVKKSVDDGIAINDLARWVMMFFPAESNNGGTSVDADYNATIKSNGRKSIQERHEAILNHYTEYFKTAADKVIA
jgi:hypothetical protein